MQMFIALTIFVFNLSQSNTQHIVICFYEIEKILLRTYDIVQLLDQLFF